MASQDREINFNEPSRRERLESQRSMPAGDPRITGQRGTRDTPFFVRLADVPDDFFDSFRRPTPAEGPQRPEERDGGDTGESMFRASVNDMRAAAEVSRGAADKMRIASDMMARFTGQLSAYNSQVKQANQREADRIDRVLSRIENNLGRADERARQAPGAGAGGRSPNVPAGPDSDEDYQRYRTMPDFDRRSPDGSPGRSNVPPGPPPPPRPSASGAGDDGGDGEGEGPGSGRHRRTGRSRPHPMTDVRSHYPRNVGGIMGYIRRETAQGYHQSFGMGTDKKPTPIRVEREDGSVVYQMHGASGQIGPDIDEQTAEKMGLISKARNAMFVSRIAGGYFRGGSKGALRGAMGGLGDAAKGAAAAGEVGGLARMGSLLALGSKAVPVIGTAIAAADAVNQGLQFAQDQRAKNAYYQNIQGGSNFAGFGERLREEGFVWGERFRTGLQEEDARRAFKGVSALGYTGGTRDRATDFISDNYRQMGMSVDQSLRALQISASGANTAFSSLSKNLQGVRDTAREAGVNASAAVDKFLDVYQAANYGASGTSASTMAGAVTNAYNNQNREFQGLDPTGVFSEGNQRMLAAFSGMTYGEFMAAQERGDGRVLAQAQTRMGQSRVGSLIGGNPDLKRVVDEMTQQAGGDPSKIDANELGIRLMEQGLDPGVAEQTLRSIGLYRSGMSQSDMADLIGSIYTGQSNPLKEYEELRQKQDIRDVSEEDRSRTFGEMATFESPNDTKFVRDHSNGLMDGLLGVFGGGVSDEMDRLTSAYDERQEKSNKVEPGIEAMIDELGDDENIGIEVDTKDGKKVVSKEDAIKFYSDQVNKGTARVVNPEDPDMDGKSLEEVTGVASKNVEGQDTTKESAKDLEGDKNWAEKAWDWINGDYGDGTGTSAEEWKKEHGGEGEGEGEEAAGGGKIKIEATEELRRFLKISGSGNVDDSQVNDAAGAGVPPRPGGFG